MVFYSGDLQFYLSSLEEERLKIQVFRRELPLCYEVVSQTIEARKEKLKDEVMSPGQPSLEEFMPPKLNDDNDDHNDVARRDEEEEDDDEDDDREEETKSGWLRSARLWNPIPDLNAQQDNGEDCRDAALPEKPSEAVTERSISSSERQQHRRGRDKGEEKQKEGSGRRKKRRCWSAELHRRFLNALQELGGPHFATPKHIKARMKVDGLTNDEIKSHLQKYRLHTSSPSIKGNDDAPTQPPQALPHLVIVGSIWVPPLDLAAVTRSL